MASKHGDFLVNELLFYIQNKNHATTKDAIIEACVKFYSLDEIMDAISLLESALKIRLSKRNKSDDLAFKLLNDLYKKIWFTDAANTQIPRFAALDLSRIPRERENSDSLVSMEQLLASVHSLKSSVTFLRENMITRELLDESLSTLLPPVADASAAAKASAASHLLAAPPASTAPPSSLALLAPVQSPSSAPILPSAPQAPLSPSAPDAAANLPSVSLNKKQLSEVVEKQRGKMPRHQRPAGKSSAPRGNSSQSIVIGKKSAPALFHGKALI